MANKEQWQMTWKKEGGEVNAFVLLSAAFDQDIVAFHDMMKANGWKCTFCVDLPNTVKIFPPKKRKKGNLS